MEQARILSKFPVGAKHPEFGALVRRARSAFIAFRETVRREVIAAIKSDAEKSAVKSTLKQIAERFDQASECLKRLENALAGD